MSAIANLISLEGIKVLSTAGTPDRILFDVAVDDGQLQSIETGVAEGKKIVFDIYPDIQRMSFDRRVKIFIISVNDFSGREAKVGTVFISPGEAGLGERAQHFTEEGAHYVLTYKVVAA